MSNKKNISEWNQVMLAFRVNSTTVPYFYKKQHQQPNQCFYNLFYLLRLKCTVKDRLFLNIGYIWFTLLVWIFHHRMGCMWPLLSSRRSRGPPERQRRQKHLVWRSCNYKKDHCVSDMPWRCDVCYRTSPFGNMLFNFNSTIHGHAWTPLRT